MGDAVTCKMAVTGNGFIEYVWYNKVLLAGGEKKSGNTPSNGDVRRDPAYAEACFLPRCEQSDGIQLLGGVQSFLQRKDLDGRQARHVEAAHLHELNKTLDAVFLRAMGHV